MLASGLAGCGLQPGGIFPRGGANSSAEGSAGAVLRSDAPLPEPFTVPLPLPPELDPVRSDGQGDYFELTQQAARMEILPGLSTEIWGYNGTFPGPTIVSRRGRRTVVRHRNELEVPTVVHLHGGKTPPEHDGYPTDLVLPAGGGHRHSGHVERGEHDGFFADGEWAYEYPADQQAATLWYHDHSMDFTGPKVYRGLAGFHLIRDDEEESLGLPSGEREIPLMIADRSFAEDGSFRYPSKDHSLLGEPGVEGDAISGMLGDCILVNGAPWPVLEVTNTRYRFRLLNASNARRYRLALDPPPPEGPSFVQIGSDLGLLSEPLGHNRIQLAQAERFDVVVDFSAYRVGEQVTLVNELGDGGTGQVMRFVVARRGNEDSQVPSTLADVRPLTRSDATVERAFTFARGGSSAHGVTLWTINGEEFDPDRIDANPRLGAVELWRLHGLNVAHPIHIHLAQSQVLSRDGNGPRRTDRGWKDTVDLDNGERAELLVRFDGYRGKYVFHCHNLEHEDMMMMANIEVI
ncbi:multicopper oxidase family protein [Haloechinothrix sp. LS1_15]|uniref:multicopper oxidase family protein n=1 Tax=Haloechinothrix sp. LS1_15 TaxID=2652248 RepID=UPI00294B6D3F|nr:multicopper oxidase family protein [Haloechinothrix sp. LS1_15]